MAKERDGRPQFLLGGMTHKVGWFEVKGELVLLEILNERNKVRVTIED